LPAPPRPSLFPYTTLFRSAMLGILFISQSLSAQVSTNAIKFNTSDKKITINKHIYGHFAEHLGRCIYGGFYVGEDNTTIPHTAGDRKSTRLNSSHVQRSYA